MGRQIGQTWQVPMMRRLIWALLGCLLAGLQGAHAQSVGHLEVVLAVPFPPDWRLGYVRDLEWDGSTLWVAENRASVVHQFDPATNTILRTEVAPASNPWGLTLVGQRLFLAAPELFPPPPYTGFGRLYTLEAPGTWLLRGEAPGNPNSQPHGCAFDARLGLVWVSEAAAARIYAVQPDNGVPMFSIPAPSADTRGLAIAYDTLWAIDHTHLSLVQLARSGVVLATYDISHLGAEPEGLAFDGATFWISENATDNLYQVRVQTFSVAEVPALGPLGLIALTVILAAVAALRIARSASRA